MEKQQLPDTFVAGKTPEAWCEILKSLHGIKLSARRVRVSARKTGNYLSLGRGMLLLPHHIDEISGYLTTSKKPSLQSKRTQEPVEKHKLSHGLPE